MNWDDLKFFLELARQKRLNQAGRKLGVDHTTVARRIEQLEQSLRCRLFESTGEGYMLTEAGQHLLDRAEGIENSVRLLRDEAAGEGVRVSGTVRVGTPEGFGAMFLTPRLGPLFRAHPELDVELLTLPRFASLATREADVLVTLDPPEQGRYVTCRLTDFTYGLYASKSYLRRCGAIRRAAQLADHVVIGYLEEFLPSPHLRYFDDLGVKRPRLTSSGMLAQLAAVRAGVGVGVLTHYMASGGDLAAILPHEAVWKRSFWLVTHADWYKLRRVRTVWDYLRSIVEADAGLFMPAYLATAHASTTQPARKATPPKGVTAPRPRMPVKAIR